MMEVLIIIFMFFGMIGFAVLWAEDKLYWLNPLKAWRSQLIPSTPKPQEIIDNLDKTSLESMKSGGEPPKTDQKWGEAFNRSRENSKFVGDVESAWREQLINAYGRPHMILAGETKITCNHNWVRDNDEYMCRYCYKIFTTRRIHANSYGMHSNYCNCFKCAAERSAAAARRADRSNIF